MKKFIITFLTLAMILSMVGCGNMQIIDTTTRFDKAIISMPNGDILEGKVDSWRDYDGSDQIQVTIAGNTYLVHSSNIVLIKEKGDG